MAHIQRTQTSQEERKRGRRPKSLSKLSQEFISKDSKKLCNPKSFAESKRNTLILNVIKDKLFEGAIKEYPNSFEIMFENSNEKSRLLARSFENNHELTFRIKTELLRIEDWEKKLESWLKIKYCGRQDYKVTMRLLVDLIFEYLGLNKETEAECMKKLSIDDNCFIQWKLLSENQNFSEVMALDMIEPGNYGEENESNRIDVENFFYPLGDETENNQNDEDFNSTDESENQEVE